MPETVHDPAQGAQRRIRPDMLPFPEAVYADRLGTVQADLHAPGRTENDVAAVMLGAGTAAGSEYLGHPPLVVAGEATSLCFAMWRRREIRRGDVVLLEAAGGIDRYHGILSCPVVVGEPSERHRAAAGALKGALEATVDAIRPGLTAGEVGRACPGRGRRSGVRGLLQAPHHLRERMRRSSPVRGRAGDPRRQSAAPPPSETPPSGRGEPMAALVVDRHPGDGAAVLGVEQRLRP